MLSSGVALAAQIVIVRALEALVQKALDGTFFAAGAVQIGMDLALAVAS